jgi:hypothetical protein
LVSGHRLGDLGELRRPLVVGQRLEDPDRPQDGRAGGHVGGVLGCRKYLGTHGCRRLLIVVRSDRRGAGRVGSLDSDYRENGTTFQEKMESLNLELWNEPENPFTYPLPGPTGTCSEAKK